MANIFLQRTRFTRPAPGDVVEDGTLADIRTTHDGSDQVGVVTQLRHELLPEQFVPLTALQRVELE